MLRAPTYTCTALNARKARAAGFSQSAACRADRSISELRFRDCRCRLAAADRGSRVEWGGRSEERKLLAFEEAILHPAPDIVHNEYGSPSGSHVGRLCYRFYTLYLD
jgi:hypothetical protein